MEIRKDMVVYSVEIPQLDALTNAFAQAPELTSQAILQAGNRALLDYQASIKGFVPVRTGRLRASTVINPMQQHGSDFEGSVGPTTNYAEAVETGTGIYGPAKRPITPKRAKVLAFKSGGKTIFAKSVKGYPGRYPVKKAFEATQPKTDAHFQAALDGVANAIAAGVGR